MPLLDPDHSEQKARKQIDAMLVAAGWDVQDRAAMNLAAAPGVAVREFQTTAGPADYLLFLGNQIAGVIEAKRVGKTLGDVEAQTSDYAAKAPKALQVPVRPLPFRYESTGVETFFTNGLDPEPRARAIFAFHRPEALREWLEAELNRRQSRPGIFYAQGVKANVLFFDRKPANAKPWTRKLWVYDLRTNQHFTLKTNPMKPADLDDFVALYSKGALHKREPTWSEAAPEGRWRAYEYDEVVSRDKCSLDLFWLKDESLLDADNLPEPDVIALEIAEDLRVALAQIEEILGDLAADP